MPTASITPVTPQARGCLLMKMKVSHPFLPQDRAEQGCALAKLGANTEVTLLPNLLSPVLGGQKADILHIILQRSRVSQRTPGPNILLLCCNCFLEGGEHFHFLPELSTMNSNNSTPCLPDGLVKPTEQNVTNRIPGRRGVGHRLK